MKTELNIVTFNIRCFGFDGDYFAKQRSESRVPFLKEFIEAHYSDVDVFIFQEIMDLSIVHKILPHGFVFTHYSHDYPRHMHVVIACKNEFQLMDTQVIANTALDLTKSRPALYTNLKKGNKSLLHLIGVHLKSSYEHTESRRKQCQIIKEYIENLQMKDPVVLTGDFNSHLKSKTHKAEDDLVYFKKIFDKQLILANQSHPTYISPTGHAQLDHFWLRGGELLSLEVYDYQKYSSAKAYQKYFNEISDHLPVKSLLRF